MRGKIFLVFLVIIVSLILTFPSSALVNVHASYTMDTKTVAPYVIYNNVRNYDNLTYTVIDKNATMADSNITSIWAVASYSDNTYSMWTNSYGFTVVYDFSNNSLYQIGTPYDTIRYFGAITGIAGTSNYNYTGNPLVLLLTENGYIFYYYTGAWNILTASTGSIIKLPGNNWTSLTANTYASTTRFSFFGFQFGIPTYFFATSLNGTVWYWDTGTGNFGLFNSNEAPQGIINTAAYYDETSVSNDNLYGLSYSGYVYYLGSNGWQIYNTTPIPPNDTSIALSGLNNPYLYVTNLANNTTLYASSSTVTSGTTSSFVKTTGKIDSSGTNEALTIYDGTDVSYPNFYVYETNGTILDYASGSSDPTSFTWGLYFTNLLPVYRYSPFLGLNDTTKTFSFSALLYYKNSKGISNVENLSIYFNNSILTKEFSLSKGIVDNYRIPTSISYTTPIAINVSLMPNTAYNANLYFSVVYYQSGTYIIYDFNVTIINHFSWFPLG